MKTLNKIDKLNHYLIGFWKIAYLNILWWLLSLLGLGVFGVGPATYAVTKYYFRWLHYKEEPAVIPTIWAYYKENSKQSVLVSWIVSGVFYVVTVNLFNVTTWYLQVANLLTLLVTVVGATHIYNVMVALNFDHIKNQIRASLMMGFGYLHYTIILWAVIIGTYYLLAATYLSLLILFGTGFILFLITLVGSVIIKEFEEVEEKGEENKNILLKGELK